MAWFQSLRLIEQFFAVFAVPATLVLILQTVMLLLGLGGSGGADTGLESDTSGIGEVPAEGTDFDVSDASGAESADAHEGYQDTGLRMFTVRGLITFFTLFGWTGLVCIQSGLHNAVCLFVAAVAGLAGMVVTALVMRAVLKLQIDGTANLANALGKTATVYIRVPAKRSERGKVNLVMQEKLMELSAVTDEDVDLPAGSEVVVVGLSSSDTLIVAVKGARVVRDKVKM